jgi:hypothetical protein
MYHALAEARNRTLRLVGKGRQKEGVPAFSGGGLKVRKGTVRGPAFRWEKALGESGGLKTWDY